MWGPYPWCTSVVGSCESVIMVEGHNFTKAGIPYWFTYDCQNIKLTGLDVAILTHDEKHCGHVQCRPPSIAIHGVGGSLGM